MISLFSVLSLQDSGRSLSTLDISTVPSGFVRSLDAVCGSSLPLGKQAGPRTVLVAVTENLVIDSIAGVVNEVAKDDPAAPLVYEKALQASGVL